ncbi:calcium-dependent protein kinase [Xylogone sp. PMI_703]|nr:calcium-dependent protein kinase [Xylogone sp. PMI_703]
MPLVPYSSRDSRNDIVLRYGDTVVLRDPHTQQLILRGVSSKLSLYVNSPTYHHPLRNSLPEHQPSPQPHNSIPTSFTSPRYFHMLQDAHDSSSDEKSPSPIHRPVGLIPSARDADFIVNTSAPSINTHNIREDTFSADYFTKFFIPKKLLGRSDRGNVMLVRHELDGVSLGQFACKRVPVRDNHAWLEKVLVEVELIQRLSHPNLVLYHHIWLENTRLNSFGPSVLCVHILQQYCNSGDLLHYITGSGLVQPSSNEILKEKLHRRSEGQSKRSATSITQGKLSSEEIYLFFKDITSGLAYLHESNYIHYNLKPSDCLLHYDEGNLRCLISDFEGMQPKNITRNSTSAISTICYCAPEVLKVDASGQYGNLTTKGNIFSLGMILYFMCFGGLPYETANETMAGFGDIDVLRAEISCWSGFKDEQRERPELPNQLYDFLKRLLSINPADRPSALDILRVLQGEKSFDEQLPGATWNGNMNRGASDQRIRLVDSPMPLSTPANERDPNFPRSEPEDLGAVTNDKVEVEQNPQTEDRSQNSGAL